MLEGLDKIDWSQLTHAYGTAGDVPVLLRQLASPNAEERESALSDLHANIWHQWTIYEATAAAVPFLIELLTVPSPADKHEILVYLSNLANGTSYCDVHQRLTSFKDEASTDEWKKQLAKELEWVQQTRTAVKSGQELYLQLLASGNTKEREAAGFLLATMDKRNPEIAPAIWNQYELEKDGRCRASLLIGFGRVCLPTQKNCSLLLDSFIQASSKVERLGAAIALAESFPEELPDDVVREIIHAEDFKELDASPWGTEQIELILEGALLCFKGNAADFAIRELQRTVNDSEHPHALRAAQMLLGMAFRKQLPKETTLESLDDFQRHVIATIRKNKAAWIKTISATRVGRPDQVLLVKLSPSDMVLRRLLDDTKVEPEKLSKKPNLFKTALKRVTKRIPGF